MNRADRLTITLEHEPLAILALSFILVLTIYLLPIPALPIILGVLYVPFFPGCAPVAALFAGSDNLEKGLSNRCTVCPKQKSNHMCC